MFGKLLAEQDEDSENALKHNVTVVVHDDVLVSTTVYVHTEEVKLQQIKNTSLIT